jgi:hypothetical protein
MRHGSDAHDVAMGWIIPALLRARVKVAPSAAREGSSSNAWRRAGWVDVVSFRRTDFLQW